LSAMAPSVRIAATPCVRGVRSLRFAFGNQIREHHYDPVGRFTSARRSVPDRTHRVTPESSSVSPPPDIRRRALRASEHHTAIARVVPPSLRRAQYASRGPPGSSRILGLSVPPSDNPSLRPFKRCGDESSCIPPNRRESPSTAYNRTSASVGASTQRRGRARSLFLIGGVQ
jgi:hypothetical protein